ncbi:MAG TPA: hypothetical protein VFI25_12130 [Planctomycetota bacterium]|jgi:hypothetical protein|nr:hypothetical protein [Planctomycetota bacterium]
MRGAVLAFSLLGAGLFLGAALLRETRLFGGTWTDGVTIVPESGSRPARRVLWKEPEPLALEEGPVLPLLEPCFAGGSSTIVFASGVAGRNVDLYAGLLADGRIEEVRPLSAVNSPFDDRAPCVEGGILAFASDRPGGAGRLDLYRAPWNGGNPSAPVPLSAANSAADDTDPAIRPVAGGLVFSSDRAGRFDLYFLEPGGGEGASPVPLGGLSSPADDRAPAFRPDGRALLFASDRAGTGSLDLFLAWFDPTRDWTGPVPLEPFAGPLEETGPSFSPEGFALLLARSEPGRPESSQLALARSVELLPASPGFSTLELLALAAALLLVALLAWLGRRWRSLDLLSKCLLLSILLHLLLLFLSRRVRVESRIETPPAESRTFRVRLVPSEEALARSRARGERVEEGPTGIVEAERASLDAPDAPPSPSEAAARGLAVLETPDAFLRPEGPPLEGPEPRSESAAANLPLRDRDPQASARRKGGSAPLLLAESDTRTAPRNSGREGRADAALPGADPLVPPATGEDLSVRGERVAAAKPRREGGDDLARALPSSPAPSVAAGETPPRRAAADQAGPALALEARLDAGRVQPDASPERWSHGAEAGGTGGVPSPGPLPLAAERFHEPLPDAVSEGNLSRRALPDPSRAAAISPTIRGPEPPAPGEHRAGKEGGTPPLALEERSFAAPVDPVAARGRWASGGGAAGTDAPPSPGPLALAPVRSDGTGLSALPGGPREPANRGLPDPPRAAGPSPTVRGPRLPGPAEGRSGVKEGSPALALEARSFAGPVESPARIHSPSPTGAPAPGAPAPGQLPLSLKSPSPVTEAPPTPLEGTPYERRSGLPKEVAIREFGGTAQTEKAVADGLRYLASIQRRDGSWGDPGDREAKYRDVRFGKTGLALLAFLGAGHTQRSGTEHTGTVDRAIRFLLGGQDQQTGHFGDCEAYGHGIASYALAEAFAMTTDPALRGPLERAVGRILGAQETRADPRLFGGWSYYYRDGSIFDEWPRASISAWQVMALESARLGGLEVSDEAFAAARSYLLRSFDEEHAYFRYSHDPERLASGYRTLPGSTPASIFALGLLGAGEDARVAAAVPFVRERRPRQFVLRSEERFVSRGEGNLYFWYYGTLAFFQRGGPLWGEWNEAMKRALLPAQQPDGSWTPIDPYARIAGDDDADRSYTTALCVLMLEVYYRYVTPLLLWNPSMPGEREPAPTPASGRRPV